jgi:hypothetical protein
MGITGAALIAAAVRMLTPDGRVRRVVTLVCGLVMIIALISPIKRFDPESLVAFSERYQEEGRAAAAGAQISEEKLMRRIIEERTAAYILDKGRSLGIDDLIATVTAEKLEDGTYVPKSARLKTRAGEAARRKLEEAITAELGIPAEELNWSESDETQ